MDSFFEYMEEFRQRYRVSRTAVIRLLSDFIDDHGVDNEANGYVGGADVDLLKEMDPTDD